MSLISQIYAKNMHKGPLPTQSSQMFVTLALVKKEPQRYGRMNFDFWMKIKAFLFKLNMVPMVVNTKIINLVPIKC